MEGEIDWDQVLPGEADWDALLPNREWKPYGESSWEHVLQAPSAQLEGLLPQSYDGSCALHAYAECLNASFRLEPNYAGQAVHHPRLLQLAAGKGVLTTQGTTMDGLANLVQNYGIPLQDDRYARYSRLYNRNAVPMPSSNSARTPQAALAAIEYRELLCDLLDLGPVVLCFEFEDQYTEPRQPMEPYCRKKSLFSITDTLWPWPRTGHCVTAYAYRCPGGDVRTLRLLYQENMKGAPGEQPARGLVMHPDAVDSFHFINLNGVQLSNVPAEGYITMRQPTPPKTWWEKTIGNILGS